MNWIEQGAAADEAATPVSRGAIPPPGPLAAELGRSRQRHYQQGKIQGLHMTADWYFQELGKVLGPYSAADLRNMAQRGRISPDDLLRKGIDGKWVKASEVKSLFDGQKQEQQPIRIKCPHCGKALKVKDKVAGKKGRCPSCGETIYIPLPALVLPWIGPPATIPQPQMPPAPTTTSVTVPPSSEKDPLTQATELAMSIAKYAPTTGPQTSHPVPRGYSGNEPFVQPPSPRPAPVLPRVEMIFCYACRKQVADNAPTCPKCGAVQTHEGRERGRQIKKQTNIIAAVVGCVLVLPIFTCCLSGMLSGNRSSSSSWDRERLWQDAGEVARDPSKTIFIPSDGSQPRVVPNPYP